MKKLLLLIVFLSFAPLSWAQITDQDKKSLEELSADFTKINNLYKEEKIKLEELSKELLNNQKESIVPKIAEQLKKTTKYRTELDSIYKLYLSYNNILLSKKNKQDDIYKIAKIDYKIENTDVQSVSSETKNYFYFGENKIIPEDEGLFGNKIAKTILDNSFSAESKTYLGDFKIPQDKQVLTIYNYETKDEKKAFFKEIKIHLKEGSICDLKLIVLDEKNNELLFENRIPINLLILSTIGPKTRIQFKTASSNNKNEALNTGIDENNYITLSDVLLYIPNPGENYIPEDLTLTFPTKKDNIQENINNPIIYKVNQDTSLQNIVELRTYTDFLGLFTDSPNGIIQLEGKADFYIAPLNLPNSSVYIFKKISPFVNFSRLDKDVRYLTLNEVEPNTSSIKNSLEIIEKSYLQMGLNINVLSFKIKKEFPFDINFYGATRYLISDIMTPDSTVVNYKSLGIGGGISLEFKRYNNFGFTYSAELTNYNSKSFNEIDGIINPQSFLVFQNKAEVYFFPGETKQQAIFLRFKTFNNSEKENNEAFYQLQFGYRFSIGIGKIKN